MSRAADGDAREGRGPGAARDAGERPDAPPHVDPRQAAVLARYRAGELSAEMTIVYCLQARPDAEALRRWFAAAACDATEARGAADDRDATKSRLRDLLRLLDDNFAGCDRIARMLASGVDTEAPARTVGDGIAFCRGLFDWSVGQSSEASVALYSLGNPRILASATAEIVEYLRERAVIAPTRDVLEIGCGTGRFQAALAGEVRSVTGIDVSPNMIEAARVRCAMRENVELLACSGRDLALFPDARFDTVLAVDSFAYLVQSGMELVRRHFEEAARVLRPGGDFLVLEFSYRGDVERDRRDVRDLAAATGFDVQVEGAHPFRIWDGAAFHMTLKDSRSVVSK